MRLFYCIHVWPEVSKLPGPLSMGQPVEGFIQTVSVPGEPYEGMGDDDSTATVGRDDHSLSKWLELLLGDLSPDVYGDDAAASRYIEPNLYRATSE
ncbi:hypothetical protein BOC40_06760 [Burkholderia pseudomallei]|nr:hypothetical protein BOC40_06760 [Burkholderia pseudomallei]ARL46259.1 hypothetical protein BOC50_25140 [Burkholderia pseudomallei]